LAGDILSLVIHESVGHPLELDGFRHRAQLLGISFATPENLDTLKYGSDIVTLVNDPPPSMAWVVRMDDEGSEAPDVSGKERLMTGYLSSRETAARIGRKSSGCMRADDG